MATKNDIIAELEQARRYNDQLQQTLAMREETIERLTTKHAELSQLCDLRGAAILAYLEEIKEMKREYSRVQGVLSSTQQFCKKYRQQLRQDKTPSDRRQAMLAAKAAAMASGTTVKVAL